MLRQLVNGLANRPDVAGVAVVSGDGLIIQQVLPPHTDPEAMAALATTLARHGEELGASAALGRFVALVLEYEDGAAIIRPMDGGASLVVLGAPDTDLGELLHLLRQHRNAIASLL